MQGLRKRKSRGRLRDAPAVGRIFRTSNNERHQSLPRHDSANPPWKKCKAFYIRERDQFSEGKRKPCGTLDPLRVHGARYTHLSNCMPYRDPAERAAWMREYRRRKRLRKAGAPASLRSAPSGVRAFKQSHLSAKRIDSSGPQPAPAKSTPRKAVCASFKTARELAQTFPFGVLASQACPYCYNTGYSSPGTRCSYCRREER